MQDVVRKQQKYGLHDHIVSHSRKMGLQQGLPRGVKQGLSTHLKFMGECSGVGLSQVRLQVLQRVVTLRQPVWQGQGRRMALEGALDGGLRGHGEE